MIIVINKTNGVAIMRLSEGASAEEALAKWMESHSQEYISHRQGTESEIPTERTFRNAWEDTGKISVNMPKAREIHKNLLREIRKPLFASLDVEYQIADEKENATLKASIADKKQLLRDVTLDSRIDEAQTPIELQAVIPDALLPVQA